MKNVKEMQERRFELEDKLRTNEEEKEYRELLSKLNKINPEMTCSPYVLIYC